jgi:hypothetical protein
VASENAILYYVISFLYFWIFVELEIETHVIFAMVSVVEYFVLERLRYALKFHLYGIPIYFYDTPHLGFVFLIITLRHCIFSFRFIWSSENASLMKF